MRFHEEQGRLQAVEVRRQTQRPVIVALHRALLAAGVVITSYQAQYTTRGLRERIELSTLDGRALDDEQSGEVRSAILPLAFTDE